MQKFLIKLKWLKNKIFSRFKDIEFIEVEYAKKIITRIKNDEQLQKIISGVLILLIAIGGAYYFMHRPEKRIYQVLVMVRDQYSSNPEEDARASLKNGDVIVVYEPSRQFSYTERISYLILKMKLTEEQAQKLLAPKEEKLKKSEISKEQMERIKKNNEPWPTKTVRARAYRIKLEKFKGFKPEDLLKGQPFENKIYSWWEMVEKK